MIRCLRTIIEHEFPTVPDDLVYGFGRMDESGRVADRVMTSALGWQPGDRLTLIAAAGVVVARRDPGAMVTMSANPYLVIPAALRRRCGLRPGDRVLLAIFPDRDTLAAYSTFIEAVRRSPGRMKPAKCRGASTRRPSLRQLEPDALGSPACGRGTPVHCSSSRAAEKLRLADLGIPVAARVCVAFHRGEFYPGPWRRPAARHGVCAALGQEAMATAHSRRHKCPVTDDLPRRVGADLA